MMYQNVRLLRFTVFGGFFLFGGLFFGFFWSGPFSPSVKNSERCRYFQYVIPLAYVYNAHKGKRMRPH